MCTTPVHLPAVRVRRCNRCLIRAAPAASLHSRAAATRHHPARAGAAVRRVYVLPSPAPLRHAAFTAVRRGRSCAHTTPSAVPATLPGCHAAASPLCPPPLFCVGPPARARARAPCCLHVPTPFVRNAPTCARWAPLVYHGGPAPDSGHQPHQLLRSVCCCTGLPPLLPLLAPLLNRFACPRS